jgi:alkaline phosphatase
MSYESLRNTESEGQPSLTEMTEAALKILNNKKNENGFVLIVEGGKIGNDAIINLSINCIMCKLKYLLDQAHHQNHARLALEEFVEFERAIRKAKDMTSNDETLIIVTSDHSHSLAFNGYATRGNDILGFANKQNNSVYETLVYSTGPGNFYHKLNNSNTSNLLENISPEKRKESLYMHESLIPLKDATHSGEDVIVFSNGPNSFLLQRVFEQSYIPYAISYAACIGPIESINPSCSKKIPTFNEANMQYKKFNKILLSPIIFILFSILFN